MANKGNIVIILLVIIAFSAIGVSTYLLGKQSAQVNLNKITVPPTSQLFTPTKTLSPSSVPTKTILPSLTEQQKNDIKLTIEQSVNPKTIVDALDISPVDQTMIVYLGHNDQWNIYGIYFYDTKTKSSTKIFELNESITGRGGTYLDNVQILFSPSGEAFFVNKTGTNFPQFFIIDSKGTILYKGDKDWGNAAWIDGKKAMYLGSEKQPPLVYDIVSKKSETSILPAGLFRLISNIPGTRIIGFTLPKTELQCQSFDLHIFSYPESKEIQTISNVSLISIWKNDTTLSYEKITGCIKNTGESMFEYSPVSEKNEITLQ